MSEQYTSKDVRTGTIDGYQWEVRTEMCLGGWEQRYYHVTAPDGEFIVDNFTEGPTEDAIDFCKTGIEDHKAGNIAKYGEYNGYNWMVYTDTDNKDKGALRYCVFSPSNECIKDDFTDASPEDAIQRCKAIASLYESGSKSC